MVSWGRGVPDWRRLASLAPRLPGLQGVLLSESITGVESGGFPGLDWECCGIYTIKVNGGGSASEEPVEPPRRVIAPLEDLDPWKCSVGLGDTVRGYLNPLGWRPILPAPGVSFSTCISVSETPVGVPRLEPLSMEPQAPGAKCVEGRRIDGKPPRIGLTRVLFQGEGRTYGTLEAVIGGDGWIVADSRQAARVSGSSGLDLELDFYDYQVYVLYPLHYRLLTRIRKGDREEVTAHSIVVKGPRGSIGLSSPQGVKAVLEPGRITIEEPRDLAIVSGSETLSYRALLEQTLHWKPVDAPPGGLGHIRPGPGAPLVVEACGRRVTILLQNPSLVDGVFEARLRVPVSKFTLQSPLGVMEQPAPGGLVRVPMPRGYIGVVTVEIEPGMLARLRMRRGGPGRFTPPVGPRV